MSKTQTKTIPITRNTLIQEHDRVWLWIQAIYDYVDSHILNSKRLAKIQTHLDKTYVKIDKLDKILAHFS